MKRKSVEKIKEKMRKHEKREDEIYKKLERENRKFEKGMKKK